MNIKKKLIMGFLVVALLFSTVCGFAIFKIMGMRSKAQMMNNNWMPSVVMMGWFSGAVSDVPRLNYAMTIVQDPGAKIAFY